MMCLLVGVVDSEQCWLLDCRWQWQTCSNVTYCAFTSFHYICYIPRQFIDSYVWHWHL